MHFFKSNLKYDQESFKARYFACIREIIKIKYQEKAFKDRKLTE